MRIAVINLNINNIGSLLKAFEKCGATAIPVDSPVNLREASAIVLPGVGSFHDGMVRLNERGLIGPILECVRDHQVPILGICLGMQLLADRGTESGLTSGLSLIPGTVERLDPCDHALKVPHIGWNEVHLKKESPLFQGINTGEDYYFVHSYSVHPTEKSHILATTPHGQDFVSSVQRDGHIFGVQFHPEKSSKMGFALIRNFLDITKSY